MTVSAPDSGNFGQPPRGHLKRKLLHCSIMGYSPEHMSQWNDFFIHNPASRYRRKILGDIVETLDFDSVIDIGCGDGSLALYLKERFGKKTSGLEYDTDRPRLAGQMDSYFNMSIAEQKPDGIFDLVVATEVLEHIHDDESALRNIRAICGKHLFITVPAGKVRRTDKHMGHVRHYTLERLTRKVEAAGFRVQRAFAWGFPFHSLYKWTQDLVPGAMIEGFGSGKYGLPAKGICHFLYFLFAMNSFTTGSQLFLLAETSKKPQ